MDGLLGELVSLGENTMNVNCFGKMTMLVSIKQPEQIDELIFLEVGEVRFSVKVKEIGLSKSFNNISGKIG
ncbi:hypothetical protein Gotri_015124 [Gossypium trilobum]|uniref:Uncharacterized protein n=1 Tax=Gossypium trilobum TaxID=34281 RepID=A0A7J9DZV6_9ROSI|nr:hypothetical protein [Gossypium trilobum]